MILEIIRTFGIMKFNQLSGSVQWPAKKVYLRLLFVVSFIEYIIKSSSLTPALKLQHFVVSQSLL